MQNLVSEFSSVGGEFSSGCFVHLLGLGICQLRIGRLRIIQQFVASKSLLLETVWFENLLF